MKSRRTLTTILFTDIVGSTERAMEMGDQAWQELLDRHHARTRREIRRFGGREINTTGDGFLATFARPARAIRCAAAIRESVEELDLEIRAGIHMGAVEHHGRDLGGVGVHIGARIAGRAAAGEILVSNAVRESETGSGFEFADRGEYELKGIPGEWRLYAVESVSAGRGIPWTDRWAPVRTGPRAGAIALAVGLALVLVLFGRWYLDRDVVDGLEPVAIAEAAPAIAVLPFRVGSEELETWREGMVDILSTNLDGIPGFRAIDSRRVLARWGEVVGSEERPDTELALEVARRAGARYAVLGSLVPSGENLRIVAELYDVESGRPLSQGQVEGVIDSIFGLTDRLSIELLQGIVEEEETLAAIDLAAATTQSLPALRAFLEGEIHLRRGDYEQAVQAYDRAIEADSTFALSWLQLSHVVYWTRSADRGPQVLKRATQHIDRLPNREALLVRGLNRFEVDPVEGFEMLREVTRRYPDEVLGWYQLGERAFHAARGAMLLDPDVALRAFERATEIDSTFAPAYIHQVHEAMRTDPDSAGVGKLIDMYERLAPGTPDAIGFRTYQTIAFGEAGKRSAAMSALDTLSAVTLLPGEALKTFSHPRFHDVLVDLLRTSIRKEIATPYSARWLYRILLFRGQVSAALDAAEDPVDLDHLLYLAHAMGHRIPAERLDRSLERAPEAEESKVLNRHIGGAPRLGAHLHRGAWALERSQPAIYQEALDTLRSFATQSLAEGDSLTAEFAEGGADALEGFRAWRAGRSEEAAELLRSARLKTAAEFEPMNILVRWWEANRALEDDDLERAAEFFQSLSHGEAIVTDPWATFQLAQVQEELGRLNKAQENYEYFVLAWRDADPELQPIVQEARQAVIRLRGVRRQ